MNDNFQKWLNSRDFVFAGAIDMCYCIVVKATVAEISEQLSLSIFTKKEWQVGARYLLSYLNYLKPFSPLGYVSEERFLIISPPINGWRIISIKKLTSFAEALTIGQHLSRCFAVAHVFYIDTHGGGEQLAICKVGNVLHSVTKVDEQLTIQGKLSAIDEAAIEKAKGWHWSLEDWMERRFFDFIKSPTQQYHTQESVVSILKQIFPEYPVANLPTEKRILADGNRFANPSEPYQGDGSEWEIEEDLPF